MFVYSGNDIEEQVRLYEKLLLPAFAKKLTAGIDWAGNSGKIIANLLFNKEAFGEAYTVSSAQNLTWGDVADIYAEQLGFTVEWCAEERFMKSYPCLETSKKWLYLYDRKFSREIDNRKVLSATGLSPCDFLPIADGLKIEIEKRNKRYEKN